MTTHDDNIQDIKSHVLISKGSQNQGSGEYAFQFVDNRTETVVQRKLSKMANKGPQTIEGVQLQSISNNFTSLQKPFQRKENSEIITQLEHKKGASRVTEARIRKNANKRKKGIENREREAQEAQEWSETVSDWASWAWEKAKGIGLAVTKKTMGGIDPFEVAQNLKTVYESNASMKKKVTVLAMYGTYEVSNFLNENMATFIGGNIGEMMQLEKDINEHVKNLSNMWENGEIDEGQVEEGVADQLIEAFGEE
jgi:hypothetical protein